MASRPIPFLCACISCWVGAGFGTLRVAARRVVVMIPARNEAAVIGTAVASLARHTFSGPIHLIVIDDGSTDGTAEAALAAAHYHALSCSATLCYPAAGPGNCGPFRRE